MQSSYERRQKMKERARITGVSLRQSSIRRELTYYPQHKYKFGKRKKKTFPPTNNSTSKSEKTLSMLLLPQWPQ